MSYLRLRWLITNATGDRHDSRHKGNLILDCWPTLMVVSQQHKGKQVLTVYVFAGKVPIDKVPSRGQI